MPKFGGQPGLIRVCIRQAAWGLSLGIFGRLLGRGS
jgi:hypothetical protein